MRQRSVSLVRGQLSGSDGQANFRTSFPLSIAYKQANAQVEIGQGNSLSFDPTQMRPGAIPFSSADNLATGDPVTYTTTGTPLSYTDSSGSHTLTSGILYAIVKSPTTIGLAGSQADARAGRALPLTAPASGGGSQTLTPNSSMVSSSTVTASSSADSDAGGLANVSQSTDQHPLGVSLGVDIAIPSATVKVDSGSRISAAGAVSLALHGQRHRGGPGPDAGGRWVLGGHRGSQLAFEVGVTPTSQPPRPFPSTPPSMRAATCRSRPPDSTTTTRRSRRRPF